ncbi:MAG: FGGY family carbohydrate kinase [Victivallaceae bacterium]|nr:FGGY family carbohydrate kinase [Victivallaceae bacterium]
MECVAAVDIGTSRIKAALVDECGVTRGLADARLDRASAPGVQDAKVWVGESAALLKRLAAEHPEIRAVAVALTGNMHAMLPVDGAGEPLLPARLWSDNSAGDESAFLNREYAGFFRDKAGNSCAPVFALPKILKFKNESPALYRRTARFLQSKDIVAHFLTGNFVTDVSDASGVLAMDINSGEWDSALLDDIGLDIGKFPAILASSAVCGRVTAEAAAATGLAAGIPVAIGAGDLATAALGGGVDGDTLSLTLGTAGQLLGAGARGTGRRLFGKIFVFAHADPERELYLASVPAGGFVFEWFARNHNLSMSEFFNRAGRTVLNDASPLFMPYILGRGAPYMDYRPCGAWHKLSAGHRLDELCLSAVFGALAALRQGADLMTGLAGPRSRLTLQALACREPAVRRLAEGLFRQNRKLAPANCEASLLGAAMLGFTAAGKFGTVGEAERAMFKYEENTQTPSPVLERLFAEYLDFAGKI